MCVWFVCVPGVHARPPWSTEIRHHNVAFNACCIDNMKLMYQLYYHLTVCGSGHEVNRQIQPPLEHFGVLKFVHNYH